MPADQLARDEIRERLDTTLFVEAGAGSGKTTALVGRVVALVASGIELSHIAAITFTEKAGAELRDRVRHELHDHALAEGTPTEVAVRCQTAIGHLDGAAIGTLHSFAQRILSEHPVEARLPPRVEVLDEVSSGIAFDRRWARVLDDLLANPALQRTLLLLDGAGVSPPRLRALALAFDGSWDLVEDRVPADAPAPPALWSTLGPLEARLAELRACCADCTVDDDGLLVRIATLDAYVARLRATDDEADVIELLNPKGERPSTRVARTGAKPNWQCAIGDVRAQVVALGEVLDDIRRVALQACLRHLGSAMRHHTLEAAGQRRAAGQLEFHDLLVMARQVLRDPVQGPAVRTALRDRYQRLLLDEFQDTDPIQIELAVRIACADPDTADAATWVEVAVEPGRLFVVGDPKQSIYRFRRADITTFLEAKARFGHEAGRAVELSANFRTVEPVIDWVNATFGALMAEPPEVAVPHPSQPPYVALDAQRLAPPGGPAVAVVGAVAHPPKTKADVLRAAEARDVTNAVVTAFTEQWPVRDGESGWRPPRLGDITILVPARTSLPFLEEALGAARVPFRTESSSLVYATRAVRDLMMVLRAADDPTDHLRIVSALRTPLLACGDDDLFRHKVEAHGSWSYSSPERAHPGVGPVAAGLAFLRELHDARHWQSPAELLDRIARERRAYELGFADGRPRDVWRRLRFVTDQARAWSEATGGSLRSYLRWVDQQTVEGARVTESVLPETDDDAVRIMTIHAAKGLEFPITIVSGLTTAARSLPNPVEVHFPRDGGAAGYKLGADVTTEEFDAWMPIDEQMSFHERIRLLYVACTRACDHLVVSLHRAERVSDGKPNSRKSSELLVAGMGDDRLGALPDLSGEAIPLTDDPAAAPSPPPPHAAWRVGREAALARAARPGAVAATALTDEGSPDQGDERGSEIDHGLQKRPRDLDLPPWLKGRYGTAVGRAVHGVLQTIDLASGAGLDAAVRAQCEAEAVPERAADVHGLVRHALAAAVVQEAAQAPHWREVYACTPIGDRLLEGYVDLLYRSPAGLVVVDHKTSATDHPAELDRRVAGYRLQGAAYALAVGRATAEPVVRVAFLFLTPKGAVTRELTDLEVAVAEVERLVAAGEELVTA